MSTSIRLQEKAVSTDPEQLGDVSVIIYYRQTIYCSNEVFNKTLFFFFVLYIIIESF